MDDKTTKSLNDILEDYQKIENELINNNGEMTEDLENILNINGAELENKLNGYEHFVRYLKTKIDYLKSMEEHYSKRRKTLENSILRCKNSMINALLITGKEKIKTDDFNFSLGKSEKWSINIDLLDNIQKEGLVDEGLAENLFKPKISEIKNKFSACNNERPNWIEIEKTNFIKVI
tara:strand:- start:868 stop:1398 length:531 start_codon:yes stop_codon:yes gene_type:complete